MMNDGYLLVFYDFPMKTKDDIRNYSKFRLKLISAGYIILQNSVYYKYIRNTKRIDSELDKLKSISITKSNVFALKITNKQFMDINIIAGKYNLYDGSKLYADY